MKKIHVKQDGKTIGTFTLDKKQRRSYKDIKQTNERRQRDARILKALAK